MIEAFAKEQVEAMLKACEQSVTWKTRPQTVNTRPTADRDHLIVLLLLDTGVRASELCEIKMGDVNINANNIKIIDGKGSKDRVVFFGKRTAKALWRYLTPRLSATKSTDYLILVGTSDDPRPMRRHILHVLLKRIGERAGVPNVYPHRFRHTFAINYLRNGGDLFTLQELLGHTKLEMVRRYARVAQIDCANAHRQANPVDNWQL